MNIESLILSLLIVNTIICIINGIYNSHLTNPSIPITTQIEILQKRMDSIFTDIPKIECKHKRSKLIRKPNIYYCADCRREVEIN